MQATLHTGKTGETRSGMRFCMPLQCVVTLDARGYFFFRRGGEQEAREGKKKILLPLLARLLAEKEKTFGTQGSML